MSANDDNDDDEASDAVKSPEALSLEIEPAEGEVAASFEPDVAFDEELAKTFEISAVPVSQTVKAARTLSLTLMPPVEQSGSFSTMSVMNVRQSANVQ